MRCEMLKILTALNRCPNVIISSETDTQLDVAARYCTITLNRLKKVESDDEGRPTVFYYKQRDYLNTMIRQKANRLRYQR